MSGERTVPPGALACPGCGRPVALAGDRRPAAFPFCSPRCRGADLGAWFAGRHVIPGRDLAEIEIDGEPPAQRSRP
jgi:endogenous inhibitor of DNA gyrase (YacG/DUF329 family)